MFRKLLKHDESDSVFEVFTDADFEEALAQGCDDVTDEPMWEARFAKGMKSVDGAELEQLLDTYDEFEIEEFKPLTQQDYEQEMRVMGVEPPEADYQEDLLESQRDSEMWGDS